jgi:hypothetical protein
MSRSTKVISAGQLVLLVCWTAIAVFSGLVDLSTAKVDQESVSAFALILPVGPAFFGLTVAWLRLSWRWAKNDVRLVSSVIQDALSRQPPRKAAESATRA